NDEWGWLESQRGLWRAMRNMNVAILGAGAMGSVIGALLGQAGHNVTLIDVWREAVEAINRDGLRIQDKAGETKVSRMRAVIEPEDVADPVDLLLVFVKSYNTVEAVRSAMPILGPRSMVLSLQNGWGNGARISEVVGEKRVLLGVCYHSATMLGPGWGKHGGVGKTMIGEVNGESTARLKAVADMFTTSGIEVVESHQVIVEIWSKLALNCVTLPTSAVPRITADKLLETSEMRELCGGLLREVVAVANAQGIPLNFEERWAAITSLCAKLAPGTKGSMLQDVERQRRTEVDVINGAIIDAGRRLKISTPFNQAMFDLVKAVENSFPNDAKPNHTSPAPLTPLSGVLAPGLLTASPSG
ncbi:MAG: 2-dehydropantoate 2-reductase, partial [Fibrobacterota bacterium]